MRWAKRERGKYRLFAVQKSDGFVREANAFPSLRKALAAMDDLHVTGQRALLDDIYAWFVLPSIAWMVGSAKREVIELVRNGDVPADLEDLSQLHDFVDANVIGWDPLDVHGDYYGQFDDPSRHEATNYWHAAWQNAIDEWIKSGAMRRDANVG